MDEQTINEYEIIRQVASILTVKERENNLDKNLTVVADHQDTVS